MQAMNEDGKGKAMVPLISIYCWSTIERRPSYSLPYPIYLHKTVMHYQLLNGISRQAEPGSTL